MTTLPIKDQTLMTMLLDKYVNRKHAYDGMSEFVKKAFENTDCKRYNDVISALKKSENIYGVKGLQDLILGSVNYDQVLESKVHTDVMPILRRAAQIHLETSGSLNLYNVTKDIQQKMRLIEFGML